MKWVLFLLLGAAALCAAQARSKSSATASGHVARGHSRRTTHRARSSAPSYQLHPDPARYQEIQQALADKGYFKGEVNGQWGDDSVDALKRFQADQKLEPDGKLNALSLIGLGLGPKHDSASTPKADASVAPHPANPSPQ